MVCAAVGLMAHPAWYVHKYLVPFTALRLVASDGVAKHGAKSVKIGVVHEAMSEPVVLFLYTLFSFPAVEVDEEIFLLLLR